VSDDGFDFGADVLPADDGGVGGDDLFTDEEPAEPEREDDAEEEEDEEEETSLLAAATGALSEISSDWNAEDMFVDMLHDAATAVNTAAKRVGTAANGEEPESVAAGEYEFDEKILPWEGEDALLAPSGPEDEPAEETIRAIEEMEEDDGEDVGADVDPREPYLEAAESEATVEGPPENARLNDVIGVMHETGASGEELTGTPTADVTAAPGVGEPSELMTGPAERVRRMRDAGEIGADQTAAVEREA